MTSSPKPLVLFALNARERRLFFGDTAPDLPGTEVAWVPDADLQKWAWAPGSLAAWAPRVLVSSWSTPPLPCEWIDDPACPLRYLCHVTGTVRQLVPRSFLERGGQVTNWGSLAAADVAEHALLLALAALRNLPAWRKGIEALGQPGVHPLDVVATRTLHGRRVGLHGFGRVARCLLELLRPFHVQASAFSEGVPASVFHGERVTPCGSLRELFEESEVLFECEALTPKTEGSVDADVLAALPRNAVFVNVGRGQVVDHAALLREAEPGRIRIALDVTGGGPLRSDSPVCRIPGAILSPHIAGPTLDRHPECGAQALDNVRAFLRGAPLQNVVTLDIYDRST